jgi:hypothetical protein
VSPVWCPMYIKLSGFPLCKAGNWGAAPSTGFTCGGLCLRTAKNACRGVPAHSGGVFGFFDEVEKNHTPHSKGERAGTWFPHAPTGDTHWTLLVNVVLVVETCTQRLYHRIYSCYSWYSWFLPGLSQQSPIAGRAARSQTPALPEIDRNEKY